MGWILTETLAELVNVVQQAIEDGDWKVDGACDPDYVLSQAEEILRANGWVRNSIDGHWMYGGELK